MYVTRLLFGKRTIKEKRRIRKKIHYLFAVFFNCIYFFPKIQVFLNRRLSMKLVFRKKVTLV